MNVGDRRSGLVLDLAAFTDPPAPYQVWRGRPITVVNKNSDLCGHVAIAGHNKALWNVPPEQLPKSVRMGKVIEGFFQVHTPHAHYMLELNSYLADASNSPSTLP